MEKGNAVRIIGSVWQSAEANITDERRNIVSSHTEVIKDYDTNVQSLLGYSVSHPACGHIEMKNPIVTLGSKEDPFGYGSIKGHVVA
ncbi:hypothetical protein ACHAPU_011415 [Fusarium lateritium]